MADPNPYQRWSGAPKHWVELPEPRRPARITADLRRYRDAVVTVLALGVTVLLVLLMGPGASVAELDAPGPAPAGLR